MTLKPITSALIGAALWLLAVILLHPSPFHLRWGIALLLLSPLVIVPLGLWLVADEQPYGFEARLWRWIATLQLPAALALMLAKLRPVPGYPDIMGSTKAPACPSCRFPPKCRHHRRQSQ